MSQSGKAGQLYPAGQTGTNVSSHVLVEQRPMWVPNSELSSFARFGRWVAQNSPLAAPAGGDQAHWTLVAGLVGVTMGN